MIIEIGTHRQCISLQFLEFVLWVRSRERTQAHANTQTHTQFDVYQFLFNTVKLYSLN